MVAKLVSILALAIVGFAEPDISTVKDSYDEKRLQLESVDTAQRSVMGRLYGITKRMKWYSKRREQLNQKMFLAEGNVRNLAKQTVELEDKLNSQKHRLSRRLRAIYMLGDEGLARAIFSSASGQELDQTLRYLKRVSEHDFNLIKEFQRNLHTLKSRQQKLNIEVRNLIGIKEKIGRQEKLLASEQKSKSDLLSRLRADRRHTVKELKGIRKIAEKFNFAEQLDTSFFEHKGNLLIPVTGKVVKDFGLFEDEEFHYRLAHKGLLFQVKPKTGVRSVHDGKVAFAAEVAGHGRTLVIDHGDHYYSVYAMNDRLLVKNGDTVKVGQTLAESSDYTYFEIRHFSDAIDPKPWLSGEGASS